MNTEIKLEGLNGIEIWERLYNKELNTKKNVLDYIEITKVLKNGNATNEQLQDTYTMIYKEIEKMSSSVKPNTIMYLKNQLKGELGKLVADKDPKEVNQFIEFFKAAYPYKERKKDFTWTLMNINKITNEQIWTTLTYINSLCLKGEKLSTEQKEDIVNMIKILVGKNHLKYVNNVKSLEKLLTILNVKIVSEGKEFRLKRR
ncbi:hypothetical protein ACQPU1_09350 [Clostridium paraputrificum]|uniref:hypothetical protein n=1 Tax=Clostridium TaxID=1485 RepID=UPI003D3368E5